MKKSLLLTLILISVFALTACGADQEQESSIDSTPVEKDVLSENIKEELGEDISEISKKVMDGEVGDDEAEAMMMEAIKSSTVMQDEYQKQKALMPIYLELSEDFRDCIEDADDVSEAEACGEESEEKAKRVGLTDDEEEYEDEGFGDWTLAEKDELLTELNMGISEMQKNSQCFESSDDFMTAMQCVQALQ